MFFLLCCEFQCAPLKFLLFGRLSLRRVSYWGTQRLDLWSIKSSWLVKLFTLPFIVNHFSFHWSLSFVFLWFVRISCSGLIYPSYSQPGYSASRSWQLLYAHVHCNIHLVLNSSMDSLNASWQYLELAHMADLMQIGYTDLVTNSSFN